MYNIIESIRRWRTRTAATSALSKMDDRILTDIGITRADIPRVVRARI